MRIEDLIIKHNAVNPEKGRILIAEPFLVGEPFERSVVLICEKGSTGYIGFVLNKAIDFYLDEVVRFDEKLPKIPIFLGGPVASKRLFFVHTLGSEINGSIPITKRLFMDGDLNQILKRLARDESAHNKVRFFIGYSGWGEGQLESEIYDDAWMVGKILLRDVFKLSRDDNKMWKKHLSQLGEKYRVWSNYTRIPMLN